MIQYQDSDRLRWRSLLEAAVEKPEDPTIIVTLRRSFKSAARPVFGRGIDKQEYVIKGQQAGRQIINDQIIARLGQAMGAPVAEPRIVEIDEELVDDPEFSYLTPGTAHGVIFIPDCSDDREPVQYIKQPENRSRFALLAVLYGWVKAHDQQFIYKTARPNLVFSVDHGHFFPSGPNWTIATLRDTLKQTPQPPADELLSSKCKFSNEEIVTALEHLQAITEQKIIQAVASPPKQWQITIEERVVLVEYLMTRQHRILSNDNLSNQD